MKKGKPIRARDEVVFFPSAASWNDESSQWEIRVDGAVFDPEMVNMRKKIMLRLLRRFMNVSAKDLDCELFRERIRPFTANALKGVRSEFGLGTKNWS